MRLKEWTLALCALALAPIPVGSAGAEPEAVDAAATYTKLCAPCHGERRYGGYAPPLIPSTLRRKEDDALARAILDGLPSTQMPPFADQLTEANASALVALLRQPLEEIRWSVEEMAASRRVEEELGSPGIPPAVVRKRLVLVVERGTGSVSILDGNTMDEVGRFHVGRIHGGIKFDKGLHRALAVTRDGTLVDYDLDRGAVRYRIKVGVNTRNIAVSPAGDFIAAANQLPQALAILDSEFRPLKSIPLAGQPSAVFHVPGSQRFILTLRDVPKLYFVAHSGEEIEEVALPEPFEDFVFVPGQPRLIASSRGGSRLLLYDYEKRKVLAELPIEGLPHLFSGSFFEREGTLHAAFNHMGAARLSIIDVENFEVASEIPLAGSGYFTRTHEQSPYLWVDSNTESIQLIDKRSLALIDTVLTPQPGKKAMHIEFTANGDRALVSLWHSEGAVVVYDSSSLEELRRIPYAMPVGKYNAANKTRELR